MFHVFSCILYTYIYIGIYTCVYVYSHGAWWNPLPREYFFYLNSVCCKILETCDLIEPVFFFKLFDHVSFCNTLLYRAFSGGAVQFCREPLLDVSCYDRSKTLLNTFYAMSYVKTTRIPMSSNRRTIPPPQAEPLPCEYVNIPPHNGMAPRPDPGAGLGGIHRLLSCWKCKTPNSK